MGEVNVKGAPVWNAGAGGRMMSGNAAERIAVRQGWRLE
jgi:hypothetical protein